MNPVLAYVLGLVTLPVLAGAAALLYWLFGRDGHVRTWCIYDDWETRSPRRVIRWISHRRHRLSRAHREGEKLGPVSKRPGSRMPRDLDDSGSVGEPESAATLTPHELAASGQPLLVRRELRRMAERGARESETER